jgi:hypothetical protein
VVDLAGLLYYIKHNRLCTMVPGGNHSQNISTLRSRNGRHKNDFALKWGNYAAPESGGAFECDVGNSAGLTRRDQKDLRHYCAAIKETHVSSFTYNIPIFQQRAATTQGGRRIRGRRINTAHVPCALLHGVSTP